MKIILPELWECHPKFCPSDRDPFLKHAVDLLSLVQHKVTWASSFCNIICLFWIILQPDFQFARDENLGHIQQGFDECMHLIFPTRYSQGYESVALLFCAHFLDEGQDHEPNFEIWDETLHSNPLLPLLRPITSIHRSSTGSQRVQLRNTRLVRILQDFFSDPRRAQSLTVTAEIFAATTLACFKALVDLDCTRWVSRTSYIFKQSLAMLSTRETKFPFAGIYIAEHRTTVTMFYVLQLLHRSSFLAELYSIILAGNWEKN